jgi:hypothetical protein
VALLTYLGSCAQSGLTTPYVIACVFVRLTAIGRYRGIIVTELATYGSLGDLVHNACACVMWLSVVA